LAFKATIDDETETKAGAAQADPKRPPTKTLVRLILGGLKYELEPLKQEQDVQSLMEPRGSGGLLMALYQYRRLLTAGPAGFEQYCHHGGYEPFYPPALDGRQPAGLGELRVDAEVLTTEHAATPVKWYFARDDQRLLGFEVTIAKDQDACEVYLADYRTVDGRSLPHRMEVRFGNEPFAVLNIGRYQLNAGN